MPDFEVWADKDDAGKHANGSYELSINGDVPDPPLSAGFGPTFGSPHGGTGPQCAIGYNTQSYLYVSSESNVYEDGDLTDQPIIFFKYPAGQKTPKKVASFQCFGQLRKCGDHFVTPKNYLQIQSSEPEVDKLAGNERNVATNVVGKKRKVENDSGEEVTKKRKKRQSGINKKDKIDGASKLILPEVLRNENSTPGQSGTDQIYVKRGTSKLDVLPKLILPDFLRNKSKPPRYTSKKSLG